MQGFIFINVRHWLTEFFDSYFKLIIKMVFEMIFIETKIFTDDLKKLLSDDDYSDFQQYLAENPDVGDVIVNSGGLRKVRWKSHGKGKSGGVRVIYYYVTSASHIRLLLIYKKGKLDNLTDSQKAVIRKLNEDWQ